MPSSSFDIWRDWINSVLASARTQVEPAAIRHTKMFGASNTSTLMWFRTGRQGTESGVFASMEHAGGTQSGPDVHGFITFLRTLPASVRQEIVEGLKEA